MSRCKVLLLLTSLAGLSLSGCASDPAMQAPSTSPRLAAAPTDPLAALRPQAAMRPWRYIVIHHSDTATGSGASFDKYHREHNGWKELGYHFVIGNGTGSADGQIEVGGRWTRQMIGAHAGVAKFNEQGIGICLVGDFDHNRPTAAQMQSLAWLCAELMQSCRISSQNIIGHSDAKSGQTRCPGRYMNLAWVRQQATAIAQTLPPENRMARR